MVQARKRAGLSQHRLAVELGERYDQSMISHVECGRRTFVYDGLVRAARVLDTSIDYLAGLTDDPIPVDDRVEELEAELRSTKEELERLQWEAEELRERLEALEALPPLTEEERAGIERADDQDLEEAKRRAKESRARAEGRRLRDAG